MNMNLHAKLDIGVHSGVVVANIASFSLALSRKHKGKQCHLITFVNKVFMF